VIETEENIFGATVIMEVGEKENFAQFFEVFNHGFCVPDCWVIYPGWF